MDSYKENHVYCRYPGRFESQLKFYSFHLATF
jgi:hypothetical protein